MDAILSEMMDIEARGLVALALSEGDFWRLVSEIDHDLLTSFDKFWNAYPTASSKKKY